MYKVKGGRATSITGPYYDQSGVAMTNNGGTPVESHGSDRSRTTPMAT